MSIHVDENSAHAVYAPSSAPRWAMEGGCSASAEAIAHLGEQEEGEEATEGTAAHDEIERVLGPQRGTFLDPRTANLWACRIDKEHHAAYGVALFIDYVAKLQVATPGLFWVEQRVYLTEQIWGRCDVAHYDEANAVLTIVDYKNGHVGVDAEENEQLRIYAAASIYTHKLPVRWIRYAIVQPNDFRPVPRVKQWGESADSLHAFASRVAAIPRGPKRFVAGEQCTYCPLFGMCEASKDLLAQVAALVAGLMRPDQVKPAQRALFLACEKPIKDSFANAQKAWLKDALANSAAPGMKVVTALKHKAWKDPEAARKLVVERLGVEGLDVPTPAQAIERGIPETEVNAMAPRPDGGPALAFATDKRPEWKPKTAAQMFAGVLPPKP